MKTLPSRSTILSSIVTLSSAAALSLSAAPVTSAPPPPSMDVAKEISPYTITERGPHHRVWSRVTAQTNALGQVHYHTNSYTELATGMNVKKNGQWVEASEEIEITPDGAVAGKGQHQVKFAGNINAANAVELTTPDGKKLKSHILGLSYFDTATGKSVLIAELKDSHGELLPTKNQALYPDAFTDFRADVRYTYTLAGFEQDIILREQPPAPAEYGLNPETTHLQVLTEFVGAPEPERKSGHASAGNTATDENLDFGSMHMSQGKAFSIGGEGVTVPVGKQWTRLEGRTFLVEEVEVKAIGNELEALPKPPTSSAVPPSKKSTRHKVVQGRELPAPKLAKQGKSLIRLADNSDSRRGFVLDYTLNLNGSQTDYVFQSDTTYYISGTVTLSGTTTFEGGTVVKYTNQPTAKLSAGAIVFKTAPYRMAIFTSKDDDTVGDTISGSTGNPTNYNGGTFISTTTSTNTYRYCRFSYAGTALLASGFSNGIWHSQFVSCGTGVSCNSSGAVNLYNDLFDRCGNGIISTAAITAQNITANNCDNPLSVGAGSATSLVNSLVTSSLCDDCFDISTISHVNSYFIFAGAGIYQSLGAGNFYLVNASTNRNAGTTSIDATLLADLKKKTTYPPIFLTNGISQDLTLSPRAQRDTDKPDLGYHYDPIDYLVYLGVTNATLTLTNGVALGYYNSAGIWLQENSHLVSCGSPTQRNIFAYYTVVQEQTINLAGYLNPTSGAMAINPYHVNLTQNPSLDLRFTTLFVPNGDSWVLYHDDTSSHWQFSGWTLRDCEIYGSGATLEANDNSSSNPYLFKNNLFHRFSLWVFTTGQVTALNNTSIHADTYFYNQGGPGTGWVVQNNILDHCDFYADGTIGYNALLNGATDQTPDSHDITVSSFAWSSGPLGDFYQPTSSNPLVNAGSQTAPNAGLYHYTTRTDQTKEGTSQVDIGYHYVALNGSNQPIDTDGDGFPDYFEDANGNGTADTGETNWNSYNSPNGLASGSALIVFTPLK